MTKQILFVTKGMYVVLHMLSQGVEVLYLSILKKSKGKIIYLICRGID